MTFDFEVSPESVDEARSLNLNSCDVAELAHTLFLMPVRLVMNGDEVFDTETGVFYLAYALPTIESLATELHATLNPPGMGLSLRLDGEDAEIGIIGFGEPRRAPFSELKEAWQTFAHKVRAFLVGEFPQLRSHPQVGAWFRNGVV